MTFKASSLKYLLAYVLGFHLVVILIGLVEGWILTISHIIVDKIDFSIQDGGFSTLWHLFLFLVCYPSGIVKIILTRIIYIIAHF